MQLGGLSDRVGHATATLTSLLAFLNQEESNKPGAPELSQSIGHMCSGVSSV
jgi:hypothetical protein